MITVMTHSGIGDISWIFSKLDAISKEKEICLNLAMCAYKRAMPFVYMHPRIKFNCYGNHGDNILMKNHEAMDFDLNDMQDGMAYPLSVNQWLIDGHNLKDMFPKQETNYKYELNFSEHAKKVCAKLVDDRIRIGLYASCYSTIRHWNFWKEEEWTTLARMLKHEFPNAIFYIIGASFDIDLGRNLFNQLRKEKFNVVNVLGKNLDVALLLIKNLDYFFSFPSGLGIVSNVLNTPTMMFLPENLNKMHYNYVPKEDKQSGLYTSCAFITPEEAMHTFNKRGRKHLEERNAQHQEINDLAFANTAL